MRLHLNKSLVNMQPEKGVTISISLLCCECFHSLAARSLMPLIPLQFRVHKLKIKFSQVKKLKKLL